MGLNTAVTKLSTFCCVMIFPAHLLAPRLATDYKISEQTSKLGLDQPSPDFKHAS